MSDRGRGGSGFLGRGNSPSPRRRGNFRGGRDQRGGGPQPRARGRGDFLARRGRGRYGWGRGLPSETTFNEDIPAKIDPHPNDLDTNALVKPFNKLHISDAERAIRPDFGKSGTIVMLRANYFAIKYPKNVVLYDYPILIEPNVYNQGKRMRTRLFELLEKDPAVEGLKNEIAHDSAQRLISKRLLPADFRAEIKFYEAHQTGPGPKSKEFTITLGDVRELKSKDLDAYLQGENPDYNPMPIISAFNLITTAHAVRTGVKLGRNRYWDPRLYGEESMPLGPSLEIWKGFYTSVRPTYKSLMINVNVAMSPFFTPYAKLSDAMRQYSEATMGARFQTFLRRVRVTTKYLGYTKKCTISGFSNTPPNKTKFRCELCCEGMISVEDYFRRKYNIKLSDGDLPLVDLGSNGRVVWVPAELCEIEPGQPSLRVIDEAGEINKYSCNPPYKNAYSITEQGLNMLGLASQESPMKAFDVEVSLGMAVVPGRVLSSPNVYYQGKSQTVCNGSWNIVGMRFHKGATVDNLAVLAVADGDSQNDFQDKDDPALMIVIGGLLAKFRASGMTVGDTIQRGFVNIAGMGMPPRRTALEAIEKELKALSHPSMLLILLSNRDRYIFSGIKKLIDCKLGISNVCMLTANLRKVREQDQYFSNIALKVNAKLGGINHQIDPAATSWLKGTILVGMDMRYPGPGSMNGTPSIIAVVASCEASFTQYPASLRLHEHEMIESVKEMMIERLEEYKKRMKGLPSCVIVFRAGVSEGQFNRVLVEEVPKIREAFKHFRDYKPKLTIVICGKRHHTRFYPINKGEADHKTFNTKTGTVVDKGVTAVYDFDFYLQAHSTSQGTIRPTHYTVLYDENQFRADTIQQGMHDLSFLWARATRSVSYVPPMYWASRACDRAKLYLHEVLYLELGSDFDGSEICHHVKEVWGNGIHENLRGSMFYL